MRRWIALFALTVASTSCSTYGSDDSSGPADVGDASVDNTVPGRPGQFTLGVTLPADKLTIAQGAKLHVQVKLQRSQDLVDSRSSIKVSASSDTSITAPPVDVPPDRDTADLELAADLGARQGDAKIEVVAEASGFASGKADGSVFVRGASGRIDTTFGTAGVVDGLFTGAVARSVLVQTDQRIVVVASCATGICLARLDPDGKLDTSFGNAGHVVFNEAIAGYTAKLQSDGKIVIAGQSGLKDTSPSTVQVRRLNADGSVDAAFGSNGVASFSMSEGSSAPFRSLAIAPDGRIVVGFTWFRPNGAGGYVGYWAIADFSGSGQLVPISGGVVYGRWDQNSSLLNGIGVRANGDMFGTGVTTAGTAPAGVFQVTAQHAYDPAFGTAATPGYWSTTSLSVDYGQSYLKGQQRALALQSSGRIVSAFAAAGTTTWFLTRFADNGGAVDTTFGTNGKSQPFDGYPTDVEADPDGRLRVLSFTDGGIWSVVRMSDSAIVDATFGEGGRAAFNSPAQAQVASMARQADGRIVVIGHAGATAAQYQVWARRIWQ